MRWSLDRRIALLAVGTGVAYYVGARLGIALKPNAQAIATLWPPNAILLAALLLVPIRAWPVVIGATLPWHLAVQHASGVPILMSLSWYASNCSEALIGAGGIRLFSREPIRFDSLRRATIFLVFGALFASLLSSFIDVGLVKLNRWLDPTSGFWDLWRGRFFSDVLSILAFVPIIVAAVEDGSAFVREANPRRWIEVAALTASVLIVGTLALWHATATILSAPMLLALPFPFLVWSAIRFGVPGASACLLTFAVPSTWGAIHGEGPFVSGSVANNVLSLQLFLIVTVTPLMALGAILRERQRAAEEARRNEARLNLVLDAAQMGTWEFDIESDKASLSERSRDILDLAHVEAKVAWDVFAEHIHGSGSLRHAARRAIDGGLPYEAEYLVERRDGSMRWVLSKGMVIRDAVGKAVRLVGVHVDVTERKRAETALREESALLERAARLRELANAMPQVVWTARSDGEIDYLNEKWYALTGTSPSSITAETWLARVHPADRAGWADAWRESIAAGRPHEREARFWSEREGRYRWHLTRALPVRDQAGSVAHWYGTATDIDDRKHAEEALRHSEAKLRAFGEELEQRVAERTVELSRTNAALRGEIAVRARAERALRASEERFAKAFRASPDAIAIMRCAEGTILEVNERWVQMFDYSRSEAMGRTFVDLGICLQDDAVQFDEMVRTEGFVREFELDLRNKQRELLRAVVSSETVDMAGEPCRIMMVRDVTARRRAEDEVMAQRRQLAHLGRVALLGELSGALAHELNQPLAAILANARAAQRMLYCDTVDIDELRAILEDIAADDRRAGAVIHRVRALLRKGDTEPQQIVANEIVAEVLELAHSDLIERGVTVSTRLASGLPSTAADRVQLQQVLLNLIMNACDAMAENPIADRTLLIETADEGAAIHVSVSDRGTGIMTEPVDAVFEPFITSKEHGLGLGLSICRSIVDAHGGRMWAENNRDGGATFHVLLPQTQVALEVPPHPHRADVIAFAP